MAASSRTAATGNATAIAALLSQHLDDARSSFSVGSLGAIAEFHRAPDEPAERPRDGGLAIVSERGGLRIELAADVTAIAYETLSGRRGRWQQGVVLCRPRAEATRQRRAGVTELGTDAGAIRERDHDALLFDIGLGARNVDFCVRTADPGLIRTLRRAADASIFAPESPVMAALMEANPHRVVLGALGRIEVYQAIGRERTPEGPHTHVLPKLLRSGRTHSANIPVPGGLTPCFSLYPPNPIVDAMGHPHPFDPGAAAAFDSLLRRWGPPGYMAEKDRVLAAVASGAEPGAYRRAVSRSGRTAARVALRQLAARDPRCPGLDAWLKTLDRPSAR